MRSDTTQLDILRDDPAVMALKWREAAQASAQQYPDDARRLRYYEREAERLERIARGEIAA